MPSVRPAFDLRCRVRGQPFVARFHLGLERTGTVKEISDGFKAGLKTRATAFTEARQGWRICRNTEFK
jgi:hypothetical protein